MVDANIYNQPDCEWIVGRGYLINECFETEPNVAMRPDTGKEPTYLIGYALRDLKKGDELLTNYGKQYWCVKAHFDILDENTKRRCKKWYSIKDKDIK